MAQGETLSNKLVRAGRAMQAGGYFVTQSAYDVSKESLKNNIGLKFAFRSTDINEIKQTLEFFGIDKDDENNQKRLREMCIRDRSMFCSGKPDKLENAY